MDFIAQIGITGIAAALISCLVAQLPNRWWFYATGIGLSASLLERFAEGWSPAILGPILLVCICAQMGCIGRGLLWKRPQLNYFKYAISVSILLGLALLILFANSTSRIAAARSLIAFLILALLMFCLHEHRKRHLWTVSVISVILVLGMVRELLGIVLAMHWITNFAPLLLTSCEFLGPFASTITLLFLAVRDLTLVNGDLQVGAERLRRLVDSTDHAICEVDLSGRITFVNATAAGMLAVPGKDLSVSCIQEVLTPDDDLSSAREFSDFSLRLTMPISRAKARILRPDRPPVSVEWSSSPNFRDGEPIGATVTLRDTTEREVAVQFTRNCAELLEMISRNKPVEEVSRLLITAVEQRLPGYCCSVLVCEDEYFRVVASRHLPEDFRSALRALPYNRIQRNAHHGSMELRDWEVPLRAIARERFAGMWTESMVSAANELLGTIALNHPFTTALEPAQRDVLRQAAQLGALAIEHHRAYERLLHQGYHDALTGLPNRLLLADRLKQALARAERNQTQIGFLSIDLDRFKDINDTLGHDAGDLFLRQISVRLLARLRNSDTLARTGGDEFTLILPDIQDVHDVGRVAASLTASLRDPFEVENQTLYGSASIGIAVYPQDGIDADTLQRNADRAMYRAKAQGGNLVQQYSDEVIEDRNRIEIELQLHRAIEEGSFSLHFQPQFTCDRRLEGFEALLRFKHPKLGMVPPSRFIPMAEESGLILPIGEWVLEEVCRQILEWQEKGLRPVRVALNVSPLQLARGDFADTMARTLQKTGVKPELLEVELTEGMLMSGVGDSVRQISEMARLGVMLSVDDFGTGYSCLSYLHQLPIHTLKIDRSFVVRMLEPDSTRCIVEAIITLAHNLGLKTVAEGVETKEQLADLQGMGCDLIQGFVFSKPLSAIDAACLLWKETIQPPAELHRGKLRLTRGRQIRTQTLGV